MCEYILQTEWKNINFQPLSTIDNMPVSAGRPSQTNMAAAVSKTLKTAYFITILQYNSINCDDLYILWKLASNPSDIYDLVGLSIPVMVIVVVLYYA